MKKKHITIIICSIVILFLVFKQVSTKKEKTIFLTDNIKRGNIEQTVIATGTIRSNNRVEVGAQVSGRITKLNVVLGQEVKKGDLIATIDSMTQENDLEKAKSQLSSYEKQLESKKVNLEVKKSKYNRASNLYKVKSISQDDYETAKQEYADAKSGVSELEELIKQAKIEVKMAETELSYTIITSPIDGVVVSIPISEGQTVNSKQNTPTIVQVADLKKMLIKPEISEGDITKLKKGQEVEFTILSLPEKIYKAKIDSIDPAMTTLTDDEYEESVSDTEAVYYYANVIVDNIDNNLRIGMTTTNTIKVAEAKNVIAIPTTALYKKGDKYYVKTLGEKEVVEEKEVKIGINDDINTEIKSGLKEGEKLILSEMKAGEGIVKSTRSPRF
ncbi:efflux RND transporter periplasmic adaptor subunit [uncultured Fusobacterium sp.]|jgi:macrolide-specific efflux system membrane fusion protein|uniref:efflux RND transporter periplasmic adaptor subunit n=1 Tax=uncultured Fusobacterium sp. TaxID=159267 RepID=UPI0025D1C003|nr:efflux RND transporter periplasmic adaptor subunit [uncultured Fusobacterium sp.]MCF2638816.1 efflux RND transporter periplasmic adaptor subunit [Fusobacterium varium]